MLTHVYGDFSRHRPDIDHTSASTNALDGLDEQVVIGRSTDAIDRYIYPFSIGMPFGPVSNRAVICTQDFDAIR